MNRPSWDEYFMEITELVSKRSTCLDKRILTTGYNGAPRGLPHCLEIGCLREEKEVASGERQELCRGLHAEQNAIVQAALYGISIKGSILYCTTQPCVTCAKMIINAGIKRIIYQEKYPDELARKLFKEAGVIEIYYE
jgi:dCMP deaminase